jgi:hypothetical protein
MAVMVAAGKWTLEVAEISNEPGEAQCAAWVALDGSLIFGYGRAGSRIQAGWAAAGDAHEHSALYRENAARAIEAGLRRMAM